MAALVPGERRSQEVDSSLLPGIRNSRRCFCLGHGTLGDSYLMSQSVTETEQLSHRCDREGSMQERAQRSLLLHISTCSLQTVLLWMETGHAGKHGGWGSVEREHGFGTWRLWEE